MNREIEEKFIEQFIAKNKRDRLRHELFDLKKRERAVGRFCHRATSYLNSRKIIYQGNSLKELEKLMLQYTMGEDCYAISWDLEYDGKQFFAEKAVLDLIGYGMPSIIIFKKLVIIETEQECGPAMKYVLLSKEELY